MNVKELKQMLSKFDNDATVRLQVNYCNGMYSCDYDIMDVVEKDGIVIIKEM